MSENRLACEPSAGASSAMCKVVNEGSQHVVRGIVAVIRTLGASEPSLAGAGSRTLRRLTARGIERSAA
jgi:hypothetical protein